MKAPRATREFTAWLIKGITMSSMCCSMVQGSAELPLPWDSMDGVKDSSGSLRTGSQGSDELPLECLCTQRSWVTKGRAEMEIGISGTVGISLGAGLYIHNTPDSFFC